MAVGPGNSNSESLSRFCNCYKVASLTEGILDANYISKFKDRYVLGEQLGWGQFGVIRKCSDKLTGEILACKSIAKDRLVTQEDVQSIKLEIEIMTRLSGHPNVVDLKAVYEEEGYVHLVMELCAGGELFHQLEEHGRFPESEARVLFRHLMQVVIYCHDKGVVHRDLKPENILLATKSSSSPIKLADFGLATYINPGQKLHGTVGSPFYIAPEVLAGGYNEAADVWSAGVILYILLSGMPPFWGKTKSRIFNAVRTAELRFPSDPWDRISESAKDLIYNMLQRDPSRRLTTQQVLDHTWTREYTPILWLPYEHKEPGGLNLGGSPLSSSFFTRNQDISFSSGSPIISDAHSSAVTCRSSFSSFLVDPPACCFEPVGFSFQNSSGSRTLEFSTPLSSMSSFAFFSPSCMAEQGSSVLAISDSISRADSVHRAENLGELMVQDSSYEEREMTHKAADEVTKVGRVCESRVSGLHSKRNRTIGHGELEEFDLVVTESVIRWASCTHLPTAMSLRSSLVC